MISKVWEKCELSSSYSLYVAILTYMKRHIETAKRYVKKKRVIALFFLCFLLVVFFLFRNSFLGFGLELLINSKLHTEKGIKCRFEHMAIESKSLVFTQLQAESPEFPHLNLIAETVRVGLRFNFREFEIEPFVTIEKPTLTLAKPMHRSGGSPPFELFRSVTRHVQLNVKEGKLVLKNQSESTPFYFSFKSDFENECFGVLSLAQCLEELSNPMLEISISSSPSEMITYFDFNHVQLPLLGKLNQYFFLVPSGEWHAESGVISGHTQLHFGSKGLLKRGDVQVELDDIKLDNAASSAKVSLESANWRTSFPLARNKESVIHKSWVDMALKAKLKGLVIRIDEHSQIELEGKLSLNIPESEGIRLHGLLDIDGMQSQIEVCGEPYYGKRVHPEFGLKLALRNDTDGLSTIDCNITSMQPYHYQFKGMCSRLDVEHINLIQKIIAPHIPDVGKCMLKEGKFECDVLAEVVNRRIKMLHLEKIVAHNLHAQFDTGKMIAFCSKLEGSIDIDLQTRQIDTWKVDVLSGDLVYHPDEGDAVMITDLSASMASQLDMFSHSHIKGRIFDHMIDLTFYGLKRHPDMIVKLMTTTGALTQHVAPRQYAALPPEKEIMIQAQLNREGDYWRVKGNMGEEDFLSFGFKLTDIPFKPTIMTQLNQLSHNVYAGWFKGKNIHNDLSAWMLYLLDVEWLVKGKLDFMGRFDGTKVKCDFSSDRLVFASDVIDVDMRDYDRKRISGSISYFFDQEELDLILPIENATCRLKKYDINFQHVAGDLYIRDGNLFIHNLVARVHNMEVKGQVDLLFCDRQPSYFEMNVHTIDGDAKGLKSLIAHFPDFEAPSRDFDGIISALPGGFHFESAMYPVEKDPEWTFAFHLSRGRLALTKHYELGDFECDLFFSSKNDAHSLRDFSGKLYVDHEAIPYAIAGKYVHVNQEREGMCRFDVELEDTLLSLAHIVGDYQVTQLNEYAFNIDPKHSHCLGSSLECLNVVTTEDLIPIEGGIQFDLDGKDLPLFGKVLQAFDVFAIDPIIFNQTVKCHDFIQVDLTYHREHAGWDVDLQCREASIGPLFSMPLHLILKKIDHTITIDEGSYGALQFSMHLAQEDDCIKIKGGSVDYYSSHLTLEEGAFDFTKGAITAAIKGSQINIQELKKEPMLQHLIPWKEHDSFKGEFQVEGTVALRSNIFESDLQLVCQKFGDDKLQLTSLTPLHIEWIPGARLLLRNLDMNLTQHHLHNHFFGLSAEEIVFDPKETCAKGVEVTISPEMLTSLIETHTFKPFHEGLSSLHNQLNRFGWDRTIQFKADMDWRGPHFAMHGKFKNGLYKIKGQDVELKNVLFAYCDKQLDISFTTHIQKRMANVKALIETAGNRKVKIQVSEQSHHKGVGDLHIEGYVHEDAFICDSLHGQLFGAQLNFSSRYAYPGSDEVVLGGEVIFDMAQMQPFLPESIRNAIEIIKPSRPVYLQGTLVLDQRHWSDSYFKGFLKGRDLSFFGYEMRNLLSECILSAKEMTWKDFRLSDQAGYILVKQIDFMPKSNTFTLNHVEVQEFRPSLLRQSKEETTKMKPFVMRQLTIETLDGTLDDLDSIKGKGSLKFLNTFKTDHNLRLIPLELITRLGLDLGLLVPVRGEIDFQIEEQKIKLTHLKNSFSEGKRSHFFFPSTNTCYIGFDGKMHIDVKMKQYVLFKITQPFTISLRGSVTKPKYSLK